MAVQKTSRFFNAKKGYSARNDRPTGRVEYIYIYIYISKHSWASALGRKVDVQLSVGDIDLLYRNEDDDDEECCFRCASGNGCED